MASQFGKMLILIGLVLVVVGFVVVFARKIPLIGKLDFSYEGRGWAVFFPLGTCLLVSAVLTLIMWLLRRF